jgi:hypothetical protein
MKKYDPQEEVIKWLIISFTFNFLVMLMYYLGLIPALR